MCKDVCPKMLLLFCKKELFETTKTLIIEESKQQYIYIIYSNNPQVLKNKGSSIGKLRKTEQIAQIVQCVVLFR